MLVNFKDTSNPPTMIGSCANATTIIAAPANN
jgi:hypothetical protein